MPTTYYGLVHPIGPYPQTRQDKKHLMQKDEPFIGGSVPAGTTAFAGHANWLEVINPIQARVQPIHGLGLDGPSPYGKPSVVVERTSDQEAMLSPHQRRAYYTEGLFQGSASQRAGLPMQGQSQPGLPGIVGGSMPGQLPPIVSPAPDTVMQPVPALMVPSETSAGSDYQTASGSGVEEMFNDNVKEQEANAKAANAIDEFDLSKNPLIQMPGGWKDPSVNQKTVGQIASEANQEISHAHDQLHNATQMEMYFEQKMRGGAGSEPIGREFAKRYHMAGMTGNVLGILPPITQSEEMAKGRAEGGREVGYPMKPGSVAAFTDYDYTGKGKAPKGDMFLYTNKAKADRPKTNIKYF